jgi:endonuclease YncB( thermonuclease family)
MKLTINIAGVDSPRIFKGVVTSIHDGDTFTAVVDQGLGIWNHGIHKNQDGLNIRLYGVNARELEQDGGIEARDALSRFIQPGDEVTLISHKWDKYAGRIDCDVILVGGVNLASLMLAEGWVAGPYYGEGPKPIPAFPRKAA